MDDVQVAVKAPAKAAAAELQRPDIRRFQIPDLDRVRDWFVPRFRENFPHLNDRQMISFLRGVVYDNEYLLLHQENGVALAQAIGAHSLDASSVMWERFVWVADPTDSRQQASAAYFYDEMIQWAKRKGIDTMIVDEKTDVPYDMIKARVGRIMTTEQKFVNIKV